MSWLGSLFNAAKVGVGLLNGIMNPSSGAQVDYETALVKANPGHFIRVTLDGKEAEKVFRMLAAHVAVSATRSRVGKTYTYYDSGAVNEGDVVFVIATPPSGGNTLLVVNNSTTKDYYVNFGQTNATAVLSTQNVVVGHKGGQMPNAVDVTYQFQNFSLGNLVVTPVQIDADDQLSLVTAPGPQIIPLSPSPSTRSPFFSRKKKHAEKPAEKLAEKVAEVSLASAASKQEVGIPFSTVLGNIGFASVIANTLFNIYNSVAGNVQIKWVSNEEGTSIKSCVVINKTNWKVTVSVNVNWSNPAIGATVNIQVGGNSQSSSDLPDNESPISSASVCAFTETQNATAVLKAHYKTMKDGNVRMYRARFAKSTPSECSGDNLSADQLLARVSALGGIDALERMSSKKKAAAPAAADWDYE